MIKLVAFDWNGTILADTQIAVKAENIALKAVGVKPISVQKFQENFDIPIIKYWENLGLSKSFLKRHLMTIEETFQMNYERLALKSRTRSGVKPVLVFLKNKQIKALIYSNHIVPYIEKHLQRLQIKSFFDQVLARPLTDVSHMMARGKQQKLHNYVLENKFKPQEVISVGDTEEEIQIGKSLGYHTVAISGGYNTTKRLKRQKPDFLIHNLAELKGIIQKLNHA